MQQRYESFLRQPSAARYLELRALLLEAYGSPQALAVQQLERDISRGGDAAVIERQINQLSSQWLLSPRFHLLVADFAQQHDDDEQFEMSLFEAHCCLEAIMATGDGSAARPFVSTYPTDVQDVAAAQDLQVSAQHLTLRDGQWFDLATCGEVELWFTGTLPVAAKVQARI